MNCLNHPRQWTIMKEFFRKSHLMFSWKHQTHSNWIYLLFKCSHCSSQQLCNIEDWIEHYVYYTLSIEIHFFFSLSFIVNIFWVCECVCVHFSLVLFFFFEASRIIYISEKIILSYREMLCNCELKLQKLQPYCTVLVNFSCVNGFCFGFLAHTHRKWERERERNGNNTKPRILVIWLR